MDEYKAKSGANLTARLPEVVEAKNTKKDSASKDKTDDGSDDSDYSLKSSYDAEVAYRHESDEEKKLSKLNKLH